MKALLYCTKGKDYLYKTNFVKIEDIKKGCLDKLVYEIDKNERLYLDSDKRENLNGKIVAEVEIDKVERIFNFHSFVDNSRFYFTKYLTCEDLLKKAQLNLKDMQDYLFEDCGYALHLTNLKVFDRPLSFDKDYIYKDYKTNAILTKAPQNMCNVYDRFGNKYVLISIQPQHLCNILNGKKTIEVRRKIISHLKNLMED